MANTSLQYSLFTCCQPTPWKGPKPAMCLSDSKLSHTYRIIICICIYVCCLVYPLIWYIFEQCIFSSLKVYTLKVTNFEAYEGWSSNKQRTENARHKIFQSVTSCKNKFKLYTPNHIIYLCITYSIRSSIITSNFTYICPACANFSLGRTEKDATYVKEQKPSLNSGKAQ